METGVTTGALPERDSEGYLKLLADWNPPVAEALARLEQIELEPGHWEMIDFLRSLYRQYGVIPPMRILVKAVGQQLGPDKGTSIYFMQLFGGTPVRTASKIAGLPKPTNCL